MEDLWKEGRNGQDSEKVTTDKGKVQTSFAGTMMKNTEFSCQKSKGLFN